MSNTIFCSHRVCNRKSIGMLQRREHISQSSLTLRLVILSLLFMTIFFTSPSESKAQNCSPQPNEVALFQHANYGGSCIVLSSGDYPNPTSLGIANDTVSSIMIGSNTTATLCQHDAYKGRCETFTDHDPNLTNNYLGNDVTSSARVYVPATASKIITFEEYPNGTEIRDQYRGAHGISFGGLYEDPEKIIVPSEGTVSGIRALREPWGEFRIPPIAFEFISGQSWVKIAAGLVDNPADEDGDFTLYGYDTNHNLVSEAYIKLRRDPTPINNTIEIRSEQANIYRVELWHTPPGFPELATNAHFAIDNLEFDNFLPPPPRHNKTYLPVVLKNF